MVASTSKVPLPEDGMTVILQANQFPIKSVKLFGSGSAEVTRTFSLSFLRSQDEPQVVEIVHLPTSLQSVDVSVTSTSGNVTILDHYHAAHPPATLSSQVLHELQSEKQRLEDERRLRQQSFTFLTTYMDSLAQCKSHHQPEAAQMVSFFDDFVEIGVVRSAVIAELDEKVADVDSRIVEETQRLSKRNSDLPVKVVTVLDCNSQVPVEAAQLTLTYVVKEISWKPEYDLHITMTGNAPSPTVMLDFRCSITQWTGENWENVSLTLTTADQVSQLIQLPEPKRVDMSLTPMHTSTPTNEPLQLPPMPYGHILAPLPPRHSPFVKIPEARIGLFPVMGLEEAQYRNGLRTRPKQSAVTDRSVVSLDQDQREQEAPEANPASQTVSQLISHGNKDPITHIANGCIFIPTDHAAHHVLVASISLQAEFMHVAVPSIDARVYYICVVKNTSEYVLLQGTVKAYLNDTHVSSTEIHSTALPQILECPLAVDTGVKTIYNHAPDALPSVGAFTGKATTTYTSAMVVQNAHAEPIRGVIVRSAIPFPADPRITIVLKEPRGLAEVDEGNVVVKEGCLARWSTAGGRKGKQAGLFEWVCDVSPGTEVLKAVWEVCAPHDLKLLEQVH